jgi:hypothetical protein
MMDQMELKHNLKSTAERMMLLHDQLQKNGKPLSKQEEELCRMAMLPVLSAALDEIKFFYVAGADDDFEHATHQLSDRFHI